MNANSRSVRCSVTRDKRRLSVGSGDSDIILMDTLSSDAKVVKRGTFFNRLAQEGLGGCGVVLTNDALGIGRVASQAS